jgi:uncharacterized protein
MLELIQVHRADLADICQRHHVKRLDVFGSAATDRFDAQTSDLDFIIEFQPLPPVPYKRAYFAVLAELEGLFNRRIDLVTTSALRSPEFAASVERTREPIYG